MKEYKIYNKKNENNEVSFQFFEANSLENIPGEIIAVLGVTMIADTLVLVKKDNGWWDIAGGKIEDGESIKECLYRENLEEAGVHIDTENMYLIGYIKAHNVSGSNPNFSKVNYMPLYISFVKYIDREWKNKKEVKERGLYSFKKAVKLLENRKDDGQLQEILEYTKSYIKSLNLRYEFPFYPKNKISTLNSSPVSQVMVFCKDNDNKFCIVKDFDEEHFSLPGGGCELDESPLNGIKREMLEEAQIIGKNFEILGTVVVNIFHEDKKIASTQHLRFVCEIDKIEEFIPRKDGYEVEKRNFITKEELYDKVMLLNNPTGVEILKSL